jgi:ribonucleotide reductase beta subunit family protein with ferritin-like domain
MANKKTPEFNKVTALDELVKTMTPPPTAMMSDHLKCILNSQEYLQKIHDEAFAFGFEKGCEATKKVEEL